MVHVPGLVMQPGSVVGVAPQQAVKAAWVGQLQEPEVPFQV